MRDQGSDVQAGLCFHRSLHDMYKILKIYKPSVLLMGKQCRPRSEQHTAVSDQAFHLQQYHTTLLKLKMVSFDIPVQAVFFSSVWRVLRASKFCTWNTCLASVAI